MRQNKMIMRSLVLLGALFFWGKQLRPNQFICKQADHQADYTAN